VVGEGLYVFRPPQGDPIWHQVVTPPEKGEVDEKGIDLMVLADRFEKLGKKGEGYWQHFGWDLGKIVLGVALAWLGYMFMNGVAEWAKYAQTGTFWGDFIIYLAGTEEQAGWLKYEPFAILIAFAAVPISRFLLAPLVYFWAKPAAKAISALSLYPHGRIEAELGEVRLQKISDWLKRFER
jgi:hypothetical protein